MSAAKTCPNCGETIPAATRKTTRKRTRAIVLGSGPSMGRRWQEKEYAVAMRVKRGELIWSPHVEADRFGSPGDYVTPERAAELAARAAAPVVPIGGRLGRILAAEGTAA